MSAASGSKNNEGSSQSYFAERNIENSNNSNKHDNSIKLRRSINEKHGLAFISASAFTAGALGAIYIINRQQNKASENESRDLHAKAPAAETVEQKQKAPQARLRPISAALNRFSGPSLGFAALLVSSVLTVSLFAASISIAKIYLGVENVTTRIEDFSNLSSRKAQAWFPSLRIAREKEETVHQENLQIQNLWELGIESDKQRAAEKAARHKLADSSEDRKQSTSVWQRWLEKRSRGPLARFIDNKRGRTSNAATDNDDDDEHNDE